MADRPRIAIVLWTLALATGALAGMAHAERLPVRKYTTAEGLAGDYIVSIDRDSRGFLWFSTRDGLSRFDGLRFTTYGIADGLPGAMVNRVLETRAGIYWIATNGGGVCRLNPRGRRLTPADLNQGAPSRSSPHRDDLLFTQHQVGDEPAMNRVNVLYEDRAGRLWVGTDDGLFRLESGDPVAFRRVNLPLLPPETSLHGVHAVIEDAEGSLWIGGGWGLTRLLPGGGAVAYQVEPNDARDIVDALLLPSVKQLWVGFRRGIVVLETDAVSSFAGATEPIVRTLMRSGTPKGGAGTRDASTIHAARWYTTADGLPHDDVNAMFLAADGRIWVGTVGGLSEFDGQRFRAYTTANGLTDNYLTSLTGDSAGNVWIGTVAGVTRMIPRGLVTYDERDGLAHPLIHSLEQDDAGRLFVVSGDYVVSQFDGTRFASTRAGVPRDAACSWMSPCGYLDRAGEWWMLTTAGLYRWSTVTRLDNLARPPRAVYTRANGLPSDRVFKLFEDRQGDFWIGLAPDGIVRWQKSSGMWRVYSETDGVPRTGGVRAMASAFVEDAAGNLWVGFYDGGVARLQTGRFQVFAAADGVPAGLISTLYLDNSGRLWIGSTQSGFARVDDPDAERPMFAPVPSTRGLNIRCATEDSSGRIYAGTSRGVYRINPASGRVQHFGVGEGLASEFVTAAFRDAQGRLWFGTISGLSRLDPAKDEWSSDSQPPRVLISALRVRGVPQRISELGDEEPDALTLAPDQNQLEIEFFGASFHSGESLKYQYRLEGIDDEWSPPTDLRSVSYGRLSPGSYHFAVRSVRSDGVVGAMTAAVTFTVLPPIYARWWFISLAAVLTWAAGFAVYRARVAQLLRVERVRARIATDLHDDIGASLSQMAILAEVARQRGEGSGSETGDALGRIAETSRGLVDSMSDIVWAINPEADSLADLVHRMRRFAEDTLSGSDIDLTFRAPDTREDLKLGADMRREIYLILKESVTNIAKHAACTSVTVEFTCDRHRLRLHVTDDGKGFDPAEKTDGNGVASMRRRVAALDGTLLIESTLGHGTSIVLELARWT